MGAAGIELCRAAPEEAAVLVADEIEALMRHRGRGAGGRPLVLGVATGRTLLPLWEELGRRCAAGRLSFGRVRAFAVDEYCGLPPGHPGRLRAELERELLARTDLPPEQLRFPDVDGDAPLEVRCEEHERALRRAGGIDLQLLGVGTNGHVAFNEPGSQPDSRTRRVHLAPATREAAVGRFGSLEAVPSAALTVGLATLREARALRVLAFGSAKAAAVRAALAEPPGPACPLSLLAGHPDLRLYADGAACPPEGPLPEGPLREGA